jgi:hypothetical protein
MLPLLIYIGVKNTGHTLFFQHWNKLASLRRIRCRILANA